MCRDIFRYHYECQEYVLTYQYKFKTIKNWSGLIKTLFRKCPEVLDNVKTVKTYVEKNKVMLQLVGSNVQNQSNYIRQIQTLSRII